VKTYLAQSDAEAQGLYDGTITEIVTTKGLEVINRDFRLHRDDKPIRLSADGSWSFWYSGNVPQEFADRAYPKGGGFTCPYQPRDRVAVREWWAIVPIGNGDRMGYIYRAEGEAAFDRIAEGWSFMDKWSPPDDRMPRRAVRTHLLCEAVEARPGESRWAWHIKVKPE